VQNGDSKKQMFMVLLRVFVTGEKCMGRGGTFKSGGKGVAGKPPATRVKNAIGKGNTRAEGGALNSVDI